MRRIGCSVYSVPDMFLRSKVQEMILRRSGSMSSGGGVQQSHLPSQHASSSTVPCDCGDGGGGKSSALFASPRLLHSSSLPTGSCTAKNPISDSETPYSMSPTSVLDAAAAALASRPDAGNKRRPWCDGCAGPHGLADALDCTDDQQKRAVKAQAPLIRSCSLDRRVEFGVKNKSSWLPLRGGRGETAAAPGDMEPSSEDYTCVISRGPNPRTVHIFGDRVVRAAAAAGGSPPPPRATGRARRGRSICRPVELDAS